MIIELKHVLDDRVSPYPKETVTLNQSAQAELRFQQEQLQFLQDYKSDADSSLLRSRSGIHAELKL